MRQNAIASCVLLVKGIETDLSSDVSTTSWTTFSVDTNGLLDCSLKPGLILPSHMKKS